METEPFARQPAMELHRDMLQRLRRLVGKSATLEIREFGEVEVTIQDVNPPSTDCADIEDAINRSRFTVVLPNGLAVGGDRQLREVAGWHFSSFNNGEY